MEGAALAARRAVARHAQRTAAALLASNVRTSPTGRAEASVVITETSTTYSTGPYSFDVMVDPAFETVVTTDLASYGPWLEGLGSRNETTSFKGYFSFRQATQQVNADSHEIILNAIEPYVLATTI
jgi:hypothetical protein